MQPGLISINEKKLIGQRMSLSLANYNIELLWRKFGTRRQYITNNITSDLFSIAVYEPDFFSDFHPGRAFERWAAMEVKDFDHVPDELETLIVPAGLYAVFNYRGSGKNMAVFQYILESWLPASGYKLDNRPHFEVLGEKYRHDSLDSEETIWIPVVAGN